MHLVIGINIKGKQTKPCFAICLKMFVLPTHKHGALFSPFTPWKHANKQKETHNWTTITVQLVAHSSNYGSPPSSTRRLSYGSTFGACSTEKGNATIKHHKALNYL
jgi:hypothetical protein